MKLEHDSVEEVKKEILKILGRHLNLKQFKVFFFGSRVEGKHFERADIDIGIEGPQRLPAEIKLEIEEELENLPFLYKIDFVDFREVSARFREVALQHIEAIN